LLDEEIGVQIDETVVEINSAQPESYYSTPV
jgi:hypothetical protein